MFAIKKNNKKVVDKIMKQITPRIHSLFKPVKDKGIQNERRGEGVVIIDRINEGLSLAKKLKHYDLFDYLFDYFLYHFSQPPISRLPQLSIDWYNLESEDEYFINKAIEVGIAPPDRLITEAINQGEIDKAEKYKNLIKEAEKANKIKEKKRKKTNEFNNNTFLNILFISGIILILLVLITS